MNEHETLAKEIIEKVPVILIVKRILESKDSLHIDVVLTIASICNGMVWLQAYANNEEAYLLCLLNKIFLQGTNPEVRTVALKTLELMSDTDSEEIIGVLSCGDMVEVLNGLMWNLA